METLKLEPLPDCCCVCGEAGEELYSPEDHDSEAPASSASLTAMLLHLNNNKVIPSGKFCSECVRRTVDSYNFSMALASKGPPSLSDKIQTLRKRLHELTQKIDVFIVVGGNGGAYSEQDIIMVDPNALAAASSLPPQALDSRGDKVYQCTVCPDSFQRVSEYKSHMSAHAPDSTHWCWSCGVQFASHDAATAHARTHTHEDLTCHACDTSFQSGGALRRHIMTCRNCPECGASFSSRGALSAHVSRVHPARCALCCARVPQQMRARHAARHRALTPYVCAVQGCALRATTRNELLSHIRSAHAETVPPEVTPPTTYCTVCKRTFGSVAALKRHSRVHKNEKIDKSEMSVDMLEDGEGQVEYLEVEALEEMEQDQHIPA